VGGDHKINIKIVVNEAGAAHRSHADGLRLQVHLVNHFRHQAVRHAVGAARAVVGADVQ